MKYPILLICLVVLTSCAPKENSETTLRVQTLEQEIALLKTENANLKVENDLYKAWWVPETIKTTSTLWPETTDPQFVEWSFSSCMQEAHRIYVAQGSDYRRKAGYDPLDITANKCQLENKIVERLKKTKSLAEGECYNLYQ